MIHPQIKHLSSQERDALFESFYVLTMGQLRTVCKYFGLIDTGKKVFLIESLKQYLLTGVELQPQAFPAGSCAQKGEKAELSRDALILFGRYKNDLKTRLFMKKLVGDRFHFTAAGNDWMHERWAQGKPPTYGEFAVWWQTEGQLQRPLKKEWAFLNFVGQRSDLSRTEVMRLWKQHQVQTYMQVQKVLLD